MPKEWYEEPPAIVAFVLAIFVLIGFIIHELFAHAAVFFTYGLDPFARIFWGGATEFAKVVVMGMGAEAASVTLISSIAIPITIVSTYTIFRKAKEKSKALVIAVALFLDPLFIDFFKDEFGKTAGKEDAIRKMFIDASGIVTFLAASYFWSLSDCDEERGKHRSKGAVIFLRTTAVLLFLIPTLAMLGFVAHEAGGHWREFIESFTPVKIIGLVGLLVVAVVRIGLSRYFERP